MSERYDHDPVMRALAARLQGRKILQADIHEAGSSAVIRLYLDNTTVVSIGVYGSLHDEAYLVFDEELIG